MKEIIDRGDAEIAEAEAVDGNLWYIPIMVYAIQKSQTNFE